MENIGSGWNNFCFLITFCRPQRKRFKPAKYTDFASRDGSMGKIRANLSKTQKPKTRVRESHVNWLSHEWNNLEMINFCVLAINIRQIRKGILQHFWYSCFNLLKFQEKSLFRSQNQLNVSTCQTPGSYPIKYLFYFHNCVYLTFFFVRLPKTQNFFTFSEILFSFPQNRSFWVIIYKSIQHAWLDLFLSVCLFNMERIVQMENI